MSDSFATISKEVIDHVNVINSYKTTIANISRKLRICSQTYQNIEMGPKDDYQNIKLEIKQRMNTLSMKNEELLKIMDWKLVQLLKIIQRSKMENAKKQKKLSQKYESIIHQLQQQVNNNIDKENSLNCQILSLQEKNKRQFEQLNNFPQASQRKLSYMDTYKPNKHQLIQMTQNLKNIGNINKNISTNNPSIIESRCYNGPPNQSLVYKQKIQIFDDQQNDFGKSYVKEQNSMAFGCIPVTDKSNKKNMWNFMKSENSSKNKSHIADKEHRLDILMNNLVESRLSAGTLPRRNQLNSRVSNDHENSFLSNANVKRHKI